MTIHKTLKDVICIFKNFFLKDNWETELWTWN